jgi:hypothetical protein
MNCVLCDRVLLGKFGYAVVVLIAHFDFLPSLRGLPPAKVLRARDILEKNFAPRFLRVASPPALPILAITSGFSFFRMTKIIQQAIIFCY